MGSKTIGASKTGGNVLHCRPFDFCPLFIWQDISCPLFPGFLPNNASPIRAHFCWKRDLSKGLPRPVQYLFPVVSDKVRGKLGTGLPQCLHQQLRIEARVLSGQYPI